MTTAIDLNCDIGEGYGRWRMPHDAELMTLVTTVNVAAGFHAGDPATIRRTVATAVEHGLDIGVHVALPDLLGFGRRAMAVTPAEVQDYCTYQIGAVAAFVLAAGGTVTHVKPHGALYAMASADPVLAGAVAAATSQFDPAVKLFLLNGQCAAPVEAHGVELVVEGFPELHYADDGSLLLERDKTPWEPATVAARALQMARGGGVETASGRHLDVQVDSMCVHSDAPNVIEVTREVIDVLHRAGIAVAPLSQRPGKR